MTCLGGKAPVWIGGFGLTGASPLTGSIGAASCSTYAAAAVNPTTLLDRASRGHCANVRYGDLVALVEALGFRLLRVAGSHHIYVHPQIDELVNLQEVGGKAKPYQVRQVARIALRYALPLRSGR